VSDEFIIEGRCVLSHLHHFDGHRRDLRDNCPPESISNSQVSVCNLKLKVVAVARFEDADLNIFNAVLNSFRIHGHITELSIHVGVSLSWNSHTSVCLLLSIVRTTSCSLVRRHTHTGSAAILLLIGVKIVIHLI